MKNSKIKCALAITLALIQMLIYASCVKEPEPERLPEENPTINLFENNKSDFEIVIPDKAPSDIVNAAKYLSEVSAGFLEEKLSVVKKSEATGENAIVLEVFGLEETDDTYVIKTEENTVRLGGNTAFATKCAVMKFINSYLKIKTPTVSVPVGLMEQKRCGELYVYTLTGGGADLYDKAMAAVSVQGLFNRDSEDLIYVIDQSFSQTVRYLQLLSEGSRWLGMKKRNGIQGLSSLLNLASDKIKCVVIWDTNVPATVNVATSIAGAMDGVVLTSALYKLHKNDIPKDVTVIDLNTKFKGGDIKSKKNEAYRFAIDNYLANGLCDPEYLFSYEDSAMAREKGDISYVVCRDYAIQNRGFVFDLSPWGDEVPKDDKTQKKGLDKETLLMIYSTADTVRGEGLTQLYGFFPFWKYSNNGNDASFTSKYAPTHCEWEYAYLFTPYDIYWNAVIEDAYNMTVHSKYEITTPLEQNEPSVPEIEDDQNKIYFLLVMGDYDSSGTFYKRFLTDYETAARDDIAQAWSINPNILQTYPDLMEYVYEKRGPNDYFVSNVGGAGWYNPSRVQEESWQKYIDHHKKYFELADMSICPDIWDVEALSETSQNAIAQYAPDGIGILVAGFGMNGHGNGKKQEQGLTASGTPIDTLSNVFDRNSATACATSVLNDLRARKNSKGATFVSFRVVWVNSEYVIKCVDEVQKLIDSKGYGWEIEVVDPYAYYGMLKQSLSD